jgi:carboxypeptidase C (cathepsin A)
MGDLQALMAEVTTFAETEYTLALMQGAKLDETQQADIADKVARYTGVSAEFVRRCNLRVNIHQFCKELLRDQSRTVGRLDSRFTGIDRDDSHSMPDHDPSMTAILGPYTATFNAYVREELGYETDLTYEILTGKVRPWKFDPFQNQFVDVAETLREAMSKNPHLQILVANGYYDLATPFFATEYSFNHLGIDKSLQANIKMSYYEAGHMMYIHAPSIERLKRDLADFVRGAVPAD